MNKINILFNKYFYYLILPFIFLQSYVYLEHMGRDYKLMNEYRYIDEITLLNGKEVSNHEYIDKNLLLNPYENKKYTSTKNIFLFDTKGAGLGFNNLVDYMVLDDYKIKILDKVKDRYHLDFNDILYSKDLNLTYFDYNHLTKDNSLKSKAAINGNIIESFFLPYPQLQADTIAELESKMLFIKNNTYEQNMQIFDRYYIHENTFMLAPINEMKLGRDKKEIFSQYGFLSVSFISSIMDIYGGFSLNNYEKAKKTVDLLYYIVSILFVFLFFKDNYLRFIFVLSLGMALYVHTYYSFSYAPAVTNSRHFLDLIIIFLLYQYGNTSNRVYFISSVVLSVFSIYIAKDYGQFLFLAMIGTMAIPLVYEYIRKKQVDILKTITFLLGSIVGFIALKTYPMMENPSIKYFLDGFYSLPFSIIFIYFAVLAIVFIQWLLLILLYKKFGKYLYSYIFTIFYTQFLYTYYVWHGSAKSIVMFLFLFALPFMIIYNLFNFKYKKSLSIGIVFILLLSYVQLCYGFFRTKGDYEDVFKTHKLYKWDHIRAGGIIATYSFDGFQDSINLIKKYNQSNKIYMISKYDNILSILSEKYSGFKFFELRSSIVTYDEFEAIKSQINNEANILFVDNDIDRDFEAEMKKLSYFDLAPFWRTESLEQRIPKLENLKSLFNSVKENYVLVEKGSLISVYKKK